MEATNDLTKALVVCGHVDFVRSVRSSNVRLMQSLSNKDAVKMRKEESKQLAFSWESVVQCEG